MSALPTLEAQALARITGLKRPRPGKVLEIEVVSKTLCHQIKGHLFREAGVPQKVRIHEDDLPAFLGQVDDLAEKDPLVLAAAERKYEIELAKWAEQHKPRNGNEKPEDTFPGSIEAYIHELSKPGEKYPYPRPLASVRVLREVAAPGQAASNGAVDALMSSAGVSSMAELQALLVAAKAPVADLSGRTVREALPLIAACDDAERIELWHEAEDAGRGRKGLLDALEARLAELEGA